MYKLEEKILDVKNAEQKGFTFSEKHNRTIKFELIKKLDKSVPQYFCYCGSKNCKTMTSSYETKENLHLIYNFEEGSVNFHENLKERSGVRPSVFTLNLTDNFVAIKVQDSNIIEKNIGSNYNNTIIICVEYDYIFQDKNEEDVVDSFKVGRNKVYYYLYKLEDGSTYSLNDNKYDYRTNFKEIERVSNDRSLVLQNYIPVPGSYEIGETGKCYYVISHDEIDEICTLEDEKAKELIMSLEMLEDELMSQLQDYNEDFLENEKIVSDYEDEISSENLIFPIDKFPEIMKKAVLDVEATTQCPKSMIATVALMAANTANMSAVRLEQPCDVQRVKLSVPDSYKRQRSMPISLYSLVLAESGEGKSTIESEFFGFLRDENRSVQKKVLDAKKSFRIAQKKNAEKRKSSSSSFKSNKYSSEFDYDSLKCCEPKIEDDFDEDDIPYDSTIVVESFNVHSLYNSAKNSSLINKNQISILSSDAGVVFSEAVRENGKEIMSFLCNNYSGIDTTINRVNAGNYVISDVDINCVLAIQPTIFNSVIDGKSDYFDSGFLPRFLIDIPESKIGKKNYGEIEADDEKYEEHIDKNTGYNYRYTYQEILKKCMQRRNVDEKEKCINQVYLKLSEEATAEYIAAKNMIERKLAQYEYKNMKAMLLRCVENALRIAATFHCIECQAYTLRDMSSTHISAKTFRDAFDISMYYVDSFAKNFKQNNNNNNKINKKGDVNEMKISLAKEKERVKFLVNDEKPRKEKIISIQEEIQEIKETKEIKQKEIKETKEKEIKQKEKEIKQKEIKERIIKNERKNDRNTNSVINYTERDNSVVLCNNFADTEKVDDNIDNYYNNIDNPFDSSNIVQVDHDIYSDLDQYFVEKLSDETNNIQKSKIDKLKNGEYKKSYETLNKGWKKKTHEEKFYEKNSDKNEAIKKDGVIYFFLRRLLSEDSVKFVSRIRQLSCFMLDSRYFVGENNILDSEKSLHELLKIMQRRGIIIGNCRQDKTKITLFLNPSYINDTFCDDRKFREYVKNENLVEKFRKIVEETTNKRGI